ncbi:XdhC family protein [Streptomyces sp. NPDC048590]|uniref:XdhC family protein n=1 Tax=Streptomyces sp. NPDC048590 TaxID=3365574 RepID=UPI003723F77C
MRDIAERLRTWHAAGDRYAVATVTRVSGSAPRDPGAALAVHQDGSAVGSVSGGCVEASVYELCLRALVERRPLRERFEYSDSDAFAVGLTCGGDLEILVQPVGHAGPAEDTGDIAPLLGTVLARIAAGLPVALARVADGPDRLLGHALVVTPEGCHGTFPSRSAALGHAVETEARTLLEAGRTGVRTLAPDGRPCPGDVPGTVTVLVETWAPPPRMLVFGAVDFAAAVVSAGRFLGYHVTVCDARPVFATTARFPDAHEVVVDWPHRYLDAQASALDGRTALCVLTHDAKFDIPLLLRALRLPLGFVGAMGSRRTHADRLSRLRDAGLGQAELARLRSPIGLDLGARTPEETAVSVAAEIIALRGGGSGLPLSDVSGAIHHAPGRTGASQARGHALSAAALPAHHLVQAGP